MRGKTGKLPANSWLRIWPVANIAFILLLLVDLVVMRGPGTTRVRLVNSAEAGLAALAIGGVLLMRRRPVSDAFAGLFGAIVGILAGVLVGFEGYLRGHSALLSVVFGVAVSSLGSVTFAGWFVSWLPTGRERVNEVLRKRVSRPGPGG